MPTVGDIFLDVRGDDRSMRVSYHQDRGVVVVSLWAGPVCRGSFRLPADDVGRLIGLLSEIVPPAGATGTPDDTGALAGADPVATAPERSAPTPEQTGDVSRSVLPLVPRVA